MAELLAIGARLRRSVLCWGFGCGLTIGGKVFGYACTLSPECIEASRAGRLLCVECMSIHSEVCHQTMMH